MAQRILFVYLNLLFILSFVILLLYLFLRTNCSEERRLGSRRMRKRKWGVYLGKWIISCDSNEEIKFLYSYKKKSLWFRYYQRDFKEFSLFCHFRQYRSMCCIIICIIINMFIIIVFAIILFISLIFGTLSLGHWACRSVEGYIYFFFLS